MIKPLNKFLPFIIWIIAITVISGYPGDKVPKVPIWQFDKLVHSVIYAVLSVTMLIAYFNHYQQKQNRLILILLVITFGVFYGGIMEILQHYIFINRSGNWYDFIANTIGAILGAILFPVVIKLLPIIRWIKL